MFDSNLIHSLTYGRTQHATNQSESVLDTNSPTNYAPYDRK